MPHRLDQKSLEGAARKLAARDPDLARILDLHGPPPLWNRKPGFSTLVNIILEQQVSLASAASIFARLRKSVVPFRPARMIALGEPHLKSLGLTRQKTTYCLHLAQTLHDKRLRLSQLSRMEDAQAKAALMKIKGVGAWSADVYLLMALLRQDVWPVNDLALAIALTDVKRLPARPGGVELSAMAEKWKPYRSVAARMLWQYYLANRAARKMSRVQVS
jgi:DNA-3-methyladenine glycosylase II